MKIKTITCHDVYNHGASLQAYALQRYLSDLGHDVEIIDYKPLGSRYQLWSLSNPIYDFPVIKQLYLLAKLPGRLVSLRRKKKFDEFTKNYLRLTIKRYRSNEDLMANPPKADVYIAGSDQIWNTLFPNGRDAAFYLDFAPKPAKRISYAASFSTDNISDEYKPFVQRMLQGFDAISIRERSSLPLLESLGRLDGVAVYDPVYLLSKEQWESLLPPPSIEGEKYLLVYDTEGSNKLKDVAIHIAKENNLKIYNVSGSRLGYSDKDYWASSPIDFVRLIRDAQYVISNSFHATSFSIIFQKDFCVINRSESINERMKSLLDELGLSDRMYIDNLPILLKSVNYSNVIPLLQEKIANSQLYLKQALEQ